MKYLTLAAAMTVLSITPAVAHADDDMIKSNYTLVPCRTHYEAQEKADTDLMTSSLKTLQTHDMPKAKALLPALEAALSHAPDMPSAAEQCGDTIVVYSNGLMDMLIYSAMISKGKGPEGVTKVVQRAKLPYSMLGFEVGWINFENKDFEKAHTAYAKGLLNDPDSYTLAGEDSLTLCNLGRPEEGLAVVDTFMAGHPTLGNDQKAVLLRKRGYALVELKRYDEGEAAYKESLKLAPGNTIAQNELKYIAEQRASQGGH